MSSWYVRRGEKIIGPIDRSKLKQAVTEGKLLASDLLAQDAAGPWMEAGKTKLFAPPAEPPLQEKAPLAPPAAPPTLIVSEVQESKSTGSDKAIAVTQGTGRIFVGVGRGMAAAVRGLSRSMATRSQRQHELKLERIRAQAMVDANRPQRPAVTHAAPPAPTGPITFAPQILQTTVVKVINRQGGGCGCSGCGLLLLLLVIGAIVWAAIVANQTQTPTGRPGIVLPEKSLPAGR